MLPEDDDDGFAWPDEPKEFDPDSLGPDVPKAPSVPDYSSRDVPAAVSNEFWAAVVLANAGVAGVSIGPMVWYFLERSQLGGAITLAGVLALVFTYRRYREFERQRTEQREAEERETETDATGGD